MHYGFKACAGAREWFVRLACTSRSMVSILLLALFALFSTPSLAQVRYYYDELGRLIEVVAPDGQSAQYSYDAAGNITSIKKLAATAISIAEFTPNGGPVGTAVSLYGTGFSTTAASNTVKFNGTTAVVSAATATSLTVAVPTGATTGAITVTNTNGTATSGSSFVVGVTTPAPTITSFTPNIGTLGTSVTVTGSNFQLAPEDNKATLGAMPSIVLKDASSPTVTQLKLSVPTEAASGKISITTPYGKATSSADFYSLPSTVNPADVEFKGRLVANGAAVSVVTTSPGKKAVLLFDGIAGQGLHLVTTSGNFASSVGVAVYAPDGRQIENLGLSNSGVADFSKRLTGGAATGTYTVILTPDPADKGTVSLSLAADVTGTLTVDAATATTVTTARAGQNGRYTFSGTAGQSISVVLSGNAMSDGDAATDNYAYVQLAAPSNPDAAISGVVVQESVATGGFDFTLLETGTYTVIVDPYGLLKGSIGVQVKSYASGTLTVDGTGSAINLSAGRNAQYTFTAEAGKGYGLAITGLSFMPAGGAMSVQLQRPDGTYIASCSFSSNDSCNFAPSLFTAAGNYKLVFDPNGSNAASFTAALSKDVTGTLTVDAATATTVTIARAGQNGRYTFSGTAGQSISVVLSGNAMSDGDAATDNYAYIQLAAPSNPDTAISGVVVQESMATGGFDFTLLESGTYTVIVDPYGLLKGSVGVQVKSYASGSLTVNGTGSAINLSAGRNAQYTFAAEAGKGYGLAITGLSFTPAGGSMSVQLQRPDGTYIAGCSFSANDSCNFASSLFTAAGNYKLVFDPSGSNAASFTAALSKDLTGTLAVDAATATTVTIARAGQNGRYTFSGTAGQSISVVLSGNAMSDGDAATDNYAYIQLAAPSNPDAAVSGTPMYESLTTGGFDFTLLETGTYTVIIDPSGLLKGSIGVQVKSYASGTLTVDGTGSAINLSAGRNAQYTFAAEAGKGYGLAITGLSFTPAGGSMSVALQRFDGTYLAGCSFSANDSCNFAPSLFMAAGNYKLVFDPSGSNAASFTAALSKDVTGTLTVDAATATTVTIARAGQNGRYTFSGTAGQSISVVLSGNAMSDGDAATDNYAYIQLTAPSNPDAAVSGTPMYESLTTGGFDFTLLETGTYTVIIDPSGLLKGSIGVQVKSYASGTLTVDGTGSAINLSAGRNAQYTFTAEAGKGYGLAITGLSFTPAGGSMSVALQKLDGSYLGGCSFSANDSCNFAPSLFTSTGNYKLVFDPSGSNAASFTAVLSKDVAGTLTVDAATATTVTIARAGQNGRYTFSGTAGQSISVVWSSNTLSDGDAATDYYTYLSLAAPSNPDSPVVNALAYESVATGSFDYTLTETGTYTVIVDPYGLLKGNIGVRVIKK